MLAFPTVFIFGKPNLAMERWRPLTLDDDSAAASSLNQLKQGEGIWATFIVWHSEIELRVERKRNDESQPDIRRCIFLSFNIRQYDF